MPVLLGAGVPLVAPGSTSGTSLVLADQKILADSGIVVLAYSVQGGTAPASPIGFIKGA